MTPAFTDSGVTIYQGEALQVLRDLPSDSIECVVTSPPYWGLRNYGTGEWDGGDPDCSHDAARKKTRYDYSLASSPIQDGKRTGTDAQPAMFKDVCPDCGARYLDDQLGLEATPDLFVDRLCDIFDEVRRVLTSTGTCFVNLGDTYVGGGGGNYGTGLSVASHKTHPTGGDDKPRVPPGLKAKDLAMVPARFALEAQRRGWYVRADIIWAKRNCMPESVTDRPTKAHEYVYLLTKSPSYYWAQHEIAEAAEWDRWGEQTNVKGSGWITQQPEDMAERTTRNARSVWWIATQPVQDAHFACMPEELASRCIRAGCPEGGVVLDPFGGAATTGICARDLGRKAVLIELNPDYIEIAKRRLGRWNTRRWERTQATLEDLLA